MRYAQGGGLTAESRSRREQVRMQAVKMFEQRAPAAKIAAELRVTEQSVRRWRQAWKAGGPAGLASKGQAARSRRCHVRSSGMRRSAGSTSSRSPQAPIPARTVAGRSRATNSPCV